MVNFEYWEWRKKRGLPVIARPASRDAVEKKYPAVAKSAGSLDSLIGALEAITERLEYLETRLETAKDDIALPVMSVIDQQNDRIMEELDGMRESMIINNKEIAG